MWRWMLSLQLKNFTSQETCLFLFITCLKFTICFVHQALTVNSCWSSVCTISGLVRALSGFPLWYVMLAYHLVSKSSVRHQFLLCIFLLSGDHWPQCWKQVMSICMSLHHLHPTWFYCQMFLIMFLVLFIFKTSSSKLGVVLIWEFLALQELIYLHRCTQITYTCLWPLHHFPKGSTHILQLSFPLKPANCTNLVM